LNRDTQIAAATDRVTPVLASLGLELFDLQLSGSGRGRTLRVVVDRDGGVDLDAITAASQAIGPLLDDESALAGPFVLEVTSPGVERQLRRPPHFRRAVGETVSIKYRTDAEPLRVRGTLLDADDDGVVIALAEDDHRRIAFVDIADARTVFEWGPSPRPDKRGRARRGARQKEGSRK
jgi:ribosome maturation factor RimP